MLTLENAQRYENRRVTVGFRHLNMDHQVTGLLVIGHTEDGMEVLRIFQDGEARPTTVYFDAVTFIREATKPGRS